MKRSRNFLSDPIVLPARCALPCPSEGRNCRTYSITCSCADSRGSPVSISAISPDDVCISRTKSSIWSMASWDGFITRSIPLSRTFILKSVGTTETSHSSSWPISSPVISQSIHISLEPSGVNIWLSLCTAWLITAIMHLPFLTFLLIKA